MQIEHNNEIIPTMSFINDEKKTNTTTIKNDKNLKSDGSKSISELINFNYFTYPCLILKNQRIPTIKQIFQRCYQNIKRR